MAEESTTFDLVELWHWSIEAANRRDIEAMISIYAPNAVWDSSQSGIGKFEGVAAIRRFFEDWIAAYDAWQLATEEAKDLGNGVLFAVTLQHGHMVGSNATLQERWSYTVVWEAGAIVPMIVRGAIDEARAGAEHLAEELG